MRGKGRVVGGTMTLLLGQVALWPHHHILGLAADVISVVVLTGARTDERPTR